MQNTREGGVFLWVITLRESGFNVGRKVREQVGHRLLVLVLSSGRTEGILPSLKWVAVGKSVNLPEFQFFSLKWKQLCIKAFTSLKLN